MFHILYTRHYKISFYIQMFPTTAWSFKISSKRIHRAISRAKGQRGCPHQAKGTVAASPPLTFALHYLQCKSKFPLQWFFHMLLCTLSSELDLDQLNIWNGSKPPLGLECSPFAEVGIMTPSICLKHRALPSNNSWCAYFLFIYTPGASWVRHAPLTGRQSILSDAN